MAIVTGITAADMGRILAASGRTIVTGEAGSDNVGMIDTNNRRPARGAMAVFTQCIGLNVGRIFSGSGRAVVATGTAATDTVVIEHRA